MKNLLSPKIKAKELMLNSDFLTALYDKNYARVQSMIEKQIKECYLDFADDILEQIKTKIDDGKKFDKHAIGEMKSIINFVRFIR